MQKLQRKRRMRKGIECRNGNECRNLKFEKKTHIARYATNAKMQRMQ